MFRFNETIIRELAACASLKLQYWCQLIYCVIKLFGRVAVYESSPVLFVYRCTVQNETVSFCTVHRYTHNTGLD